MRRMNRFMVLNRFQRRRFEAPDPGPEGDKGGAGGGGGGGAPPADGEKPVTQQQFGQVLDLLERTGNAIGTVAQHLNARGTPPPAPKDAPKPPDPTDVALRIASGDLGPVRDVVREETAGVIRDALAPYLGAQAGDAGARNEEEFRAAVDADLGEPGAFDKVFKPHIDVLLRDNPAGRSLKSHYQEAVNLVYGRERKQIGEIRSRVQEARTAADKERQEREAAQTPPSMLGAGMHLMNARGEVQFDQDDEEYIRKVEAANGGPGTFDRDLSKALLAAAVKGSKGQPHVRASVSDLLAAGRKVTEARKAGK